MCKIQMWSDKTFQSFTLFNLISTSLYPLSSLPPFFAPFPASFPFPLPAPLPHIHPSYPPQPFNLFYS